MTKVAGKARLLHVQLNITNRCNCQCLHCFASSGSQEDEELSTSKILSLIDEMSHLRVPMLTISGGEPCLHQDLCKIVARAASQGILVSLLTNGTFVTDALARSLSFNGLLAVGVSIDGTPETHDYIRQYPGSFSRAVHAIHMFKRYGVAVGITMTINKLNYQEASYIIALAKKLGVRLSIQKVVLLGRALANKELLELPYDFKERLDVDVLPYLEEEPIDEADVSPLNKCSAGRTKCVIETTGEVSPCSYITISAGNVQERGLEEIWLNSPVFYYFRDSKWLDEPCHSCHVYEKCGGGCRALALIKFGSLAAPDPLCPHR